MTHHPLAHPVQPLNLEDLSLVAWRIRRARTENHESWVYRHLRGRLQDDKKIK